MRRTARTLLTAGALVLTLGIAAPAQAGPAHPVPITGTLVGTEMSYPAGTWDLVGYFYTLATEFDIDGDGVVDYTCSEPAHELVVGTLTGTVAHLGQVTREMSYCVVFDSDDQEFQVFDFDQVLMAANGDTLSLGSGPFECVEGDGWMSCSVPTPIVGGTGRFLNASGVLEEAVMITPSWYPPGFPYTTEGGDPWLREVSLTYTRDSHISYDASNRAGK